MTKSTAKSKFSTSPSKKTIILVIGLIVICGFAIWTTIKDVAAPPEKQIEKMNDREREFVSSVLDKITSATTKEELVKMWGEPEKNTLNSKLEWWK